MEGSDPLPDRRSAHLHGPFTTWQWAVLGAYAVAIILSVGVGYLAGKAQSNTERIDRALCAEIRYLEHVRPNLPTTALIIQLRALEPRCERAQD